MLNEERYRIIQELIEEKNTVTVAELAKVINTSESTIRRDLTTLDELGKIRKFFGGATKIVKNEGLFEDSVSVREQMMSKEKTEIAKYCAELINDNDFVFIDAGTTTSRLVDFIKNNKATYITNGITHGRKLIHKGFNTYIIGGKIKPVTEAIIGAEGIANLSNFNFSKAFMGANGVDINAGYTTPDIEESLVKEAAVKKSYHSFVLVDSTKFNRVFPVSFAEVKKGIIITDKLTDNRYAKETVVKEVMR